MCARQNKFVALINMFHHIRTGLIKNYLILTS